MRSLGGLAAGSALMAAGSRPQIGAPLSDDFAMQIDAFNTKASSSYAEELPQHVLEKLRELNKAESETYSSGFSYEELPQEVLDLRSVRRPFRKYIVDKKRREQETLRQVIAREIEELVRPFRIW